MGEDSGKRWRRFCFALTVMAVGSGAHFQASAQGWQLATNLILKADVTVKEAFDSNVYLQDHQPATTVVGAAQPDQESFVTSVTPKLALDWKPLPEFNLATSYAPEVVTYHAEPDESHVTHRAALTMSGQVGIVSWEQFNNLTVIDGDDEGLTFGGPGGAPAIGGIPIRDRRSAIVYRNGFRAFHPHGKWFFRPVAWSYVHDFQTERKARKDYPYYQNYVDRNDFTVGMDTGYKAFKEAYLIVGYRFGFQDEPPLPNETEHYSNDYHRFVAGLEGNLFPWVKVAGVVGAGLRNYCEATAPGFEEHHTQLYYDATITFTLTKQDTLTILLRQYEQPAFGAPSAYEDITWDATLRHRFDARWSASAGFRAYGGEWLDPVKREDWIYTPMLTVNYAHDQHWSGEFSYSHEWATSDIPHKSGREFTRNLAYLALKYAF